MFALGKRKRFQLNLIERTISFNSNFNQMQKEGNQLDFKGQKVFVGMDVHKLTWKVASCTVNTNPTKWPVTIRKPFVKNLKVHLNKHYPGADYICAYEAGNRTKKSIVGNFNRKWKF